MKKRKDEMKDDLRPGVQPSPVAEGRSANAKRYDAGTNLVLLDPGIRRAFPGERAVNEALRQELALRRVGGRKGRV
jgi:hypothetical protein